ncbi:hypothetical protein CE91St38_04820 [Desulfovibrionaceae bacterium]|nr:hypothetical protein CE91St38_04820 [Desulfovibrionaceae bacterium]GKI11025.1 hypothetical protein CE91St39_04790 [Desulfovibrionaceae bacterium]
MSNIPVTGFMRLPQVLAVVPVSKSAWWDGCRTGRYPKPAKLGPRTTAWRAEDIAALVKRLGAQADQNADIPPCAG